MLGRCATEKKITLKCLLHLLSLQYLQQYLTLHL